MAKRHYPYAEQTAFGIRPTQVRGTGSTREEFYEVQLERLAFAMLDIEYNDSVYVWDKDYIREGLLLKGFFTVTKDNNGNLLPLKCGCTGINVFNRPTEVIVANPIIGSFQRTIGIDCEVVYLQSKQGGRFRNIRPIITTFAQKLANCDAGIDINLFNSRTPMIFRASSENVAESYKAMYDQIADGQPAVFIDEDMGKLLQNSDDGTLYMIKAKENFVADLIQQEKQSIINEFLSNIGINSSNTEKKERLVVDEVNSNNVEIKANIKLWQQNVNDCVDRVNAMFPDAKLKITFPFLEDMEKAPVTRQGEEKFNYQDEEEGESDDAD